MFFDLIASIFKISPSYCYIKIAFLKTILLYLSSYHSTTFQKKYQLKFL
ncbi:hypothetical protein CLOSTASPAR_06660 [[Clostridium] asparagiforme DSM 15981]|uniref:Uncharacterized protein n=1 Tax=[Clostridium] asparagiforme DSM 15981 TaxID=518636 RepID=C0DBK5_9FIRM|nr:hypothetical protein CLOSTASPAR_06660 [[Clostridium] asparagiforme DSM 15981]